MILLANKHKKNPATIGLNSSQVEGQGTTENELTSGQQQSSSKKKQKKH
ncbi:MAG: YuzL family protein [Bacillaceae bacterium]|nr:YuzL family protein [Bacillaceae bacterium]